MPTSLRCARAVVALAAAVSVFGAGPARGLPDQAGTHADTAAVDLPAVADPETAPGEDLAESLRAFDSAVVALAEDVVAADAARTTAAAELESASAAHAELVETHEARGDLPAALPGAGRVATPTTDMFRTLHVRKPATASLGAALSAPGEDAEELARAARFKAEAEANAAEAAAEAEAVEAALAEAEAAEAEVMASVEQRIAANRTVAEARADADAAEARATLAEAETIAESLEQVEASRAAREAAAVAEAADSGGGAPAAIDDQAAPAVAPAPAPAPAPEPPPAPAPPPLPDPTGAVSGVLAAVWCADGRQIIVDGSIGGNVQLLVNDARSAGIGICAKSGFRSYAEQVELRRANCGNSEQAILHAPPSTCSPPTARPGTSNHEDGLAVDFSCDDSQPMTHASPCYQWLAANAARYGLHNLPSEPWHWSVSGR